MTRQELQAAQPSLVQDMVNFARLVFRNQSNNVIDDFLGRLHIIPTEEDDIQVFFLCFQWFVRGINLLGSSMPDKLKDKL